MRPEGYAPFQYAEAQVYTSSEKGLPESVDPQTVGLDHWGQRTSLGDWKITDKTRFYTTFTGSMPTQEQFRGLLSDTLSERDFVWWENAVKRVFAYTHTDTINASDMKHFFVDPRGLQGNGTEQILERLREKGLIVRRADFESASSEHKGMFAWTASLLFSGVKAMYSMATGSSVKEANTEYVYLPNIEAEAKRITDWIDTQLDLSDRIMTVSQFKELFPEADSLVLKHLENTLQRCYRFKNGGREAITLLTKPTALTEDLVTRDRSVLNMKGNMVLLQSRCEALEKQVEGLGKDAVTLKKAGKQQAATNKMKLRRQAETKLREVSGTIENLQLVINKLNENELLPDILGAMKSGAAALKEQNAAMPVAQVDEIMMDVQEEYEKLEEVNRALAGEPMDLSEFEEELEALTASGKPHDGAGPATPQIKAQEKEIADPVIADPEADALMKELENLTLEEPKEPPRKEYES